MKINQHVVPHPRGWAVKPERAEKPTQVFDTQREAIERAREIAQNQKSKVVIHGRDGKIRAHLRKRPKSSKG